MDEGKRHDCIFCTRAGQPAVLFETPHYYAMPDKFPLRPGHVLIITREHRRCHAEASMEELRELEETARRVRRFLEERYGGQVYLSENGIAHQTVRHAHLHLVPFPIESLPPEIAGYDGVMLVEGWREVREHFIRRGHYRYMELGGRRYVIDPYGPGLQTARHAVAERAGLRLIGDHAALKTTTAADVREVNRRWAEWAHV